MRKYFPGELYDPYAPRPHLQKYPEPFDHERHVPFLRQRAQAKFRDEIWHLTFEEWCSFWPLEKWIIRSRNSDGLCMTRIDHNEAWAIGNIKVISRKQQLSDSNKRIGRKPRGPNKVK